MPMLCVKLFILVMFDARSLVVQEVYFRSDQELVVDIDVFVLSIGMVILCVYISDLEVPGVA